MKTAILLLALLPYACDKSAPNPLVCSTPLTYHQEQFETGDHPTDDNGTRVFHRQNAAESCVHREAYKLAHANDGAETVAKGVVATCGPAINQVGTWVMIVERDAKMDTGEDPYKAAHDQYSGLALYFVLQARAGNCPVPDPGPLAPTQ